jgi:hypothetical protein
MSEQNANQVRRGEAFLLWLLIWFAIIGVFHYRAQIRDLQRRVAVLEGERR